MLWEPNSINLIESGSRMQRLSPLGIILLAAMALRIGALALYLSSHGGKAETWEYETLAVNLHKGRGYTLPFHNADYRSSIVPVYPLVCWALHMIGGPGLGLYHVFHILTALTLLCLIYFLAERWFGRATAVAASSLAAIEPGLLVYQSYKVDVVGFASLLLLLGIHMFASAREKGSMAMAAAGGLVLGAGILSRPDLAALAALLAVIATKDNRPTRVILPAVLAASVVLAPWLARNYAIHGRILLTTISAENLWFGNNPNANGTSQAASGKSQFKAAPEAFRSAVESAGELGQNRIFKEAALAHIAADPAGFLLRSAKKFYYFWWFTPTYGMNHYDWLPGSLKAGYRLVYLALLALSVLGAWHAVSGSAGQRRFALDSLAVIAGICAIHSVYFVEGRHRLLIMPLLLIFAGKGLVDLVSARTKWLPNSQ